MSDNVVPFPVSDNAAAPTNMADIFAHRALLLTVRPGDTEEERVRYAATYAAFVDLFQEALDWSVGI